MEAFQIVTFSLGTEAYGVPIEQVQEIIRPSPVTYIPYAPPHVLGLINLRGNVIPVIDLRRRLSLDPQGDGKYNRIIVVYLDDIVVGLWVDAVSAVTTVREEMLADNPEGLSVGEQFIDKVVKTDERLIALLNIPALIQH
ncbi:purine-binding chemotaxis protein chew, putative [Heliomicrobium modesticaldum Ice1]|uniref:Purine-binding chemotaxis protein chew, putative n=1 Tax=Heliobacterium modesticaldum (strain ATCC 51547 / Ice1) TaxID=498761 RepID=B0TC93_HELMI|nr:chemotaxis protein CheW [Heliomicrobium modesticaldum]ABZ83992.1 purine-binding chemotaxis protein chew, putative [Heliomicrobium modesticaldum Ice1]